MQVGYIRWTFGRQHGGEPEEPAGSLYRKAQPDGSVYDPEDQIRWELAAAGSVDLGSLKLASLNG